MWFFDATSASASWSVQRKGVDGLSRCLNGDMAAVMEKAKRPGSRGSYVSDRIGNSFTAAVNLSAGRTSVGMTVNPLRPRRSEICAGSG